MDPNKPAMTLVDSTESELRNRLAAIVDSSDDAIVSKTLDGIITSWNPGAERLFGYTAVEAIGQHIFLIIPEDRREEEIDVLARLRRGERIDHFETVRHTKDGRRVPISLTVSPIRDARGNIIGASKVGRDITERLKGDEIRARLASIVDSADDAIVSKTLDAIITSWNRGAERVFGYTAVEAIGQHIFLIIPEDRREEEIDLLAGLRRGERIDHFETVRQTKDGRRVPVSLTLSPIRDAQGNIIGASKVGRDITERLKSDEMRARLAAIIDSADDAIVSKTLDGIITSWNRGAERLFGYTAAEAVGQSIRLIIPQERAAEEDDVLARLRRGEKIEHFETIRETKDGRQVPVSLTVSPIIDARGKIIGASKVARDITERTVAQEALKRAHEELEERVRERTAELSNANDALRMEVAERQRVEQQRTQLLTRLVLAQEDERRRIARDLHDQLGQQLTALRLTLETLKAQSTERTEFRVQVETLEELARQLDQDVSFRVWELRPTPLENVGLRAALSNFVHNWSKHCGVHVRLHTGQSSDEPLAPEVETMIYRFAQEALNNVAKHARAQHVDIVLERNGNLLSVIIEDNGVGFNPSDTEGLGNGLGLTGMRERATLFGADLQIESTSGVGTTIILRVPATARSIQSA